MSTFMFKSQPSPTTSGGDFTIVSITNANSPYAASYGEFVLCDSASGAITVTPPSAASNGGKRFAVRKTTSNSNIVTITGIDALNVQNQDATIVSDGSANFIYDRYTPFELMTQNSSTKTPTASNNYNQMTNNSLTLTPGRWRLFGSADCTNSGAANYTNIFGGWYGANGADSGVEPSALSGVSGLTINTADQSPTMSLFNTSNTGSVLGIQYPLVIVTCTQNATIFLVPAVTVVTAANARVVVSLNAERIN